MVIGIGVDRDAQLFDLIAYAWPVVDVVIGLFLTEPMTFDIFLMYLIAQVITPWGPSPPVVAKG